MVARENLQLVGGFPEHLCSFTLAFCLISVRNDLWQKDVRFKKTKQNLCVQGAFSPAEYKADKVCVDMRSSTEMGHGWRQPYLTLAFLTALTMSDYHVRHAPLSLLYHLKQLYYKSFTCFMQLRGSKPPWLKQKEGKEVLNSSSGSPLDLL